MGRVFLLRPIACSCGACNDVDTENKDKLHSNTVDPAQKLSNLCRNFAVAVFVKELKGLFELGHLKGEVREKKGWQRNLNLLDESPNLVVGESLLRHRGPSSEIN
jgi:hypothetical protein